MDNHVPIKSITAGQIAKFLDLQAAALRKSGLPSEQTQQVLESQGDVLANEVVAMLRKHVKAIINMIVRHVLVNRSRSWQEAIDATGRSKYLTDNVSLPQSEGEGEEADVVFFEIDRYISDSDLDKEYKLRGLKPADPYALAAVNETDPAFADHYPNGTHWKDADDNWCYVAFLRWRVERRVDVGRRGREWSGGWWFAGVRK